MQRTYCFSPNNIDLMIQSLHNLGQEKYVLRLVQYSTVQYSIALYSTVQYSTVQYSTAKYSTVQCSTVYYDKVENTVKNNRAKGQYKKRKEENMF